MPPPNIKKRRRWWWLLALPLLPIVGYLAVANFLLSSGALEALISANPQAVILQWDRAWTYWPARVHIRGFYLRSQDRSVEWELTLDEAETEVALLALLQQQFYAEWVNARGVELRIRPKLHAYAKTGEDPREQAALYPAIRGLPEVPLREHTAEKPKKDPEKKWTVRLEGVTVEKVKGVWIGPYRGTLDARVTGRMVLYPSASLELGPATLELKRAELNQGALPITKDLSGKITTTIKVPKLRETRGVDVFEGVDAVLSLQGHLESLRLLNYHFPEIPELGGGASEMTLDVSVRSGRFLPGSGLMLTGRELFTQLPVGTLRGAYTIKGEVTRKASRPFSTLSLEVKPLRFERTNGSRLFEAPFLSLTFSGSDAVVGKLPADARVSLRLAPTAPFNLRLLNIPLAGGEFRIDSGVATVSCKLDMGPGAPEQGGSLKLRVKGSRTRWVRTQLGGDALIHLDLAKLRWGKQSADLSGSSIELSNVEVIGNRDRPRGWGGKLEFPSATFRMGSKPQLTAEWKGAFSDARPFLALFGDKAGIPGWAQPLLEAQGLTTSGSLDLQEDSLAARGLEAKGEGLAIRGCLDQSALRTAGLFFIRVRGFGLGLKFSPTGVETKVLSAEDWFEKERRSAGSRCLVEGVPPVQ
jgi:hypothetical protein